MKDDSVTHLFLDIGGVLLTNGWDHHSRKKGAAKFKFSFSETEARHRPFFELYEEGKITLEEYLERVIFYKDRPFTQAQFCKFLFAQSKPHLPMIKLVTKLKEKYRLKIFVVSNEGKEINIYRIQKYRLDRFVDAFISSSFVGIRKPNKEIFQLALNLSWATPQRVVYIENTPLFIEIAQEMEIQTILHKDYESTRSQLASFNLL